MFRCTDLLTRCTSDLFGDCLRNIYNHELGPVLLEGTHSCYGRKKNANFVWVCWFIDWSAFGSQLLNLSVLNKPVSFVDFGHSICITFHLQHQSRQLNRLFAQTANIPWSNGTMKLEYNKAHVGFLTAQATVSS